MRFVVLACACQQWDGLGPSPEGDTCTQCGQVIELIEVAHMGLDPGIAPFVEELQHAGVETFDSCQGGDGHAAPEPVVRFFGDMHEGFRALAVALRAGLPVLDLRRFWQVVDGEPCGPYWELAFARPAARSADTADSRPCHCACSPAP